MKGICYLVQEPTTVGGKPLNVTGLMEYGQELRTLIPRDHQVMTTAAADDLVDRLFNELESFRPDQDYLVATGDPAAIGITCSVVADLFGRFTILKWDKQQRSYYPVEIVIWSEDVNDRS